MNIATPDTAFEKSFLPNDGVGLAREEFIIAGDIGIHPLACLNYHKLPNGIKREVDKKTFGAVNKEKFYRDNLRQSAVIRQLEIIGEAAKNVPASFRQKYPKIPWKELSGFRDILSHAYFGINIGRVWNIIEKDLSSLKKEIEKIDIKLSINECQRGDLNPR